MLRTVLEKQAADIVMPDITRCGGISEMRKMANLAKTYNEIADMSRARVAAKESETR